MVQPKSAAKPKKQTAAHRRDLSKLGVKDAMNEGRWCSIIDPRDGEEFGFEILCLGEHSEVYQKAKRAIAQKWVQRRATHGRKMKIDVEETEREVRQTVAAACVDWRGLPWGDGTLEYSAENLKMIFDELEFVYEQVAEFIGETGNYLPQLETISK